MDAPGFLDSFEIDDFLRRDVTESWCMIRNVN